ncbi:MAG: hypothetical protein Q9167_004905 [Letrouitia subvulpina]
MAAHWTIISRLLFWLTIAKMPRLNRPLNIVRVLDGILSGPSVLLPTVLIVSQWGRGEGWMFDILHVVVFAKLSCTVISLDVKQRGEKGRNAVTIASLYFSIEEAVNLENNGSVQACHGEGCASLVEPANHDPGLVLPGEQGATMAESPSDVPGDEAESEDPEDEEAGVVGEVEFRGKGAEVVKRAAGCEGGQSEEGYR